ncbi:MAG: hypothetical protein FWG56_08390 [Desulfovibrionaceae bacterium]|nr:hypothetical protein [Desulfovibrionaceae bacterium]
MLKFKLPELLKDLDKVLYIDGDTIINKDLYDFYCSDLHEFYAAVIEDIKPKYHYKPNILEKLKIKKHRGYFNSGVLLLNLQKMRVEGIVEKLFDYRENGLNFFMDQDALNVIFSDNVKYVSCLYNFLVTLPDNFSLDEMKKNYLSLDGYKDFQQIYSNSYIVHFSSKDKPWKTRGVRFSEYWNRYYLESKAYEKNLFFHHEIKKFLLEKEIILSFTSFPKRINLMEDVIAKLLNQSYRPNKIILWLAKDQFPNKEKDLPNYLKNIDGNNFYIEWCEDIKSYKKLVPSLRIFKDATVVTCDDDILYDKNWLLELVAEYLKNPEVIHCHRAHEISLDTENMPLTYKKWRRNTKNEKISYRNFFTGCGGVLYPQNTFDKRVLDSEKFMNICSHGDDIWFWGMAVMNKKKINVIQNSCFKLTHSPHTQDDALWIENDQGGRNDVMLKNLFTEFNELNNVLGNESLTDLD